jgi:hypothetical protein
VAILNLADRVLNDHMWNSLEQIVRVRAGRLVKEKPRDVQVLRWHDEAEVARIREAVRDVMELLHLADRIRGVGWARSQLRSSIRNCVATMFASRLDLWIGGGVRDQAPAILVRLVGDRL